MGFRTPPNPINTLARPNPLVILLVHPYIGTVILKSSPLANFRYKFESLGAVMRPASSYFTLSIGSLTCA